MLWAETCHPSPQHRFVFSRSPEQSHGAVPELEAAVSQGFPGEVFPCAAAPETQSRDNPGVLLPMCCSHFSSHHKVRPGFTEEGGERERDPRGISPAAAGEEQPVARSSFVRRQSRRTSHSGLWDPGQQHQMLAVDAAHCCEMVQKTPPALRQPS